MKILKSFAIILFVPTAYAMVVRGFYGGNPWEFLYSVMLLSFIVAVPLAVGILTVVLAPEKLWRRWLFVIFAPWAPALLFFGITLAIAWEGWICWIMILPLFLQFTTLGGIIGRLIKNKLSKRSAQLNIAFFALIPFLFAPLESQIDFKPKTFSAVTYIDISAPKEKIWGNVTRVRMISEQEDQRKLSGWLGFPRPLYAELDTLMVGGRRLATFDRGLVFDEVVNVYEHNKKMSFSITPITDKLMPNTLDDHVAVGGKYFNVLDGAYEIEDLGNNTYRLHLVSHFQLRTSFNFYSGMWSEWIMKDIQNNILQVIKKRSEG